MAYGRLELVKAENNGVVTIGLSGELDASQVQLLDEALVQAESASGTTAVIVDITNLQFMDSSGIAALVWAAQRSRADGDRLQITGSTPAVERVLEISGVLPFLPREKVA